LGGGGFCAVRLHLFHWVLERGKKSAENWGLAVNADQKKKTRKKNKLCVQG